MRDRRRLWRFIWWVYFVLLWLLVVVKFDGSIEKLGRRLFHGEPAYNLVPFRSLKLQWRYIHTLWGRRNIWGNLLPFIPLGFILPGAHPGICSAKRFFPFALAFILSIELFQLVTRLGSFDIDDILLNMLGAALGYLPAATTKKQ